MYVCDVRFRLSDLEFGLLLLGSTGAGIAHFSASTWLVIYTAATRPRQNPKQQIHGDELLALVSSEACLCFGLKGKPEAVVWKFDTQSSF